MLFVDDGQAEAGELDILLDEGVRADDEAGGPAGQAVAQFPLQRRARPPLEEHDVLHADARRQAAHIVEVLLG